jgi:hypothetical protein
MKLVNVKNLEKKSFSKLVSTMNTCVANIVENKALVIKIVSVIQDSQSWKKKANYTKTQLKQLDKAGVYTPWKEDLKTVLEGMNPLFSYSEYVKYLKLMKQLDLSVSARLHPDALTFLNTYRYSKDFNKMASDLVTTRGIITKEVSVNTVYRYIKKRVVKEEVVRKNNRAISILQKFKKENKELKIKNKALKEENRKLKAKILRKDNKINKLVA